MSLSQNYPTTRPTLTLDFAKAKRVDPRVTFTRASTATYFDASGTLRSAQANAPRIDFNPSTLLCQGLLIEESRTNSIRNNTMQGAVAGTPGTAPTNWFAATTSNGLSREIVGTGTENGITYVDIRYSGTTSAASLTAIYWETATQVAALINQVWTNSVYVSLVGGSTANITFVVVGIDENNSGGNFLAGGNTAFTPSAGALNGKRYFHTRTLTNASTAFAWPYVFFSYGTGAAIDITLRIGLPQLELGAFATSVIPTTTTSLTRAADVANVNTVAPWYNAAEGTLYVQAQDMSDAAHATSQPRAVSLNDTTTSNTVDISRIPASAQGRARIEVAGANQFNSLTTAWPLATQAKIALAYKANNYAACLGGGTVFTNTASSLIPTVTALSIGDIRTTVSNHWVGWIQRITYYNTRLPNAQLQALTAP